MRNKWERDATYVTNQLIGKRAKKSPNLEQERERSVYTQHGKASQQGTPPDPDYIHRGEDTPPSEGLF